MSFIRKVTRIPSTISLFLVVLGSICLVAMVFGQTYEVVLRYVFGRSTGVMDEIISLGLVTIIVTGIGYTLKEGGHVRITMLTDRLNSKAQICLKILMSFLSLICCILAAYYLFLESADSFHDNVRSLSPLSTKLYIPQGALGFGFACLALELMRELYVISMSFHKKH